MSKPSDIELKTAIVACVTMKEHGKDPFFVAKSLLNHHYRLKHYETLFKAADRYINHGQAERAHMELARCIEKIKQVESYTGKLSNEDFGLE